MTIIIDGTVGANKGGVLDSNGKLPVIDGSQVTTLSATQITTGTVATARGYAERSQGGHRGRLGCGDVSVFRRAPYRRGRVGRYPQSKAPGTACLADRLQVRRSKARCPRERVGSSEEWRDDLSE